MKRILHSGELLKIRISQLANGLHQYHFSSNSSEIGLESNFKKAVLVDVSLDKATRQIYLKSDVVTSGFFQCDRCLDEFEQNVSSHFNMFYVYDELDSGRFPADEVQVISLDTLYIDLTEDVRQVVMLAIPLKLLCKEDCKGLCPQCGTNWNHRQCTCNIGAGYPQGERLKDLFDH